MIHGFEKSSKSIISAWFLNHLFMSVANIKYFHHWFTWLFLKLKKLLDILSSKFISSIHFDKKQPINFEKFIDFHNENQNRFLHSLKFVSLACDQPFPCPSQTLIWFPSSQLYLSQEVLNESYNVKHFEFVFLLHVFEVHPSHCMYSLLDLFYQWLVFYYVDAWPSWSAIHMLKNICVISKFSIYIYLVTANIM